MRLQETAWREPWMTEEERRIMGYFMVLMRRVFKARGIQDTPLIALRVIDVGIHCLLIRRLELALIPTVKEDGEVTLDITGAAADHIGKTRERLRKAIRELEDACARLGSPVDIGIADKLLPFVREARDLIQNGLPDEAS